MKIDQSCTRRHAIRSLLAGSLVMPGIVSNMLANENKGVLPGGDTLLPRSPQFSPKAKRVIFIYNPGGVSHVDSFDYKEELIKRAKAGEETRGFVPPYWDFKPRGKSGIHVSDLFPHIGECVDDLCIINSMHTDNNDHFEATLGIHTGSYSFKRPSVGSWVSYGLGTENQNLPSFVVLAPKLPYAGEQVWSADFLPGCHAGAHIRPGDEPVPNISSKHSIPELQELEMSFLQRYNRMHKTGREADSKLDARIKSYETAYGMQKQMPEAVDISRETDATLKLYGLERGQTTGFGWQALVARRLAERGVRFIELIDVGASNNWDSHSDMKAHEPLARNIDKPIAGLLKDLKSRGMLEETLVVWTTEFGRSPHGEGKHGRGHFGNAFSSWMAGGGVKGGMVYGKTDERGGRVVENMVHVHDFHATILHLLGYDHEQLTFRHAGRDYRLTDVAGRVVHDIIA